MSELTLNNNTAERYTQRFSGLPWAEYMKNITVSLVGCGGIGSNAAVTIARLGIMKLNIFDFDTVEDINMAGQLFKIAHIGNSKVSATAEVLNEFTNVEVFALQTRVTKETLLTKITVCGLDSMAARKEVFESWYDRYKGNQNAFFVDCRMSVDTAQLYCFTGDDEVRIKDYMENALFSDEEAEPTLCSAKQTTYIAFRMAAMAAEAIVDFVNRTYVNKFSFLPYFVEYDSISKTLTIK